MVAASALARPTTPNEDQPVAATGRQLPSPAGPVSPNQPGCRHCGQLLHRCRQVGRDDGGVIFDGFSHQLPDIDPEETAEWVDSFDAILDARGKTRARFLLMKLLERARENQVGFPATVSTPYVNTIPPDQEPWFPGDEYIERRIRAYIRWNAAIMVVRANHAAEGIGGHLATFASSASLYEVGFNHFFRGKANGQAGDQVYFQGHAAPGIYARAFLEGPAERGAAQVLPPGAAGPPRPDPGGLSSYPHPRLMPDFWEFPTVSMGLGPAQRHLPGPLQPLPAAPPDRRHLAEPGVVLPRRRRVRRARDPGRPVAGRTRATRQSDLRRQLQPAAPRRSGPGQRQDHPGAGSHLPRRRVERHQGGVGRQVGRAAGPRRRRRPPQQDEHHGRRRVPEIRHRGRRLHPASISSARTHGCGPWSSTSPTTTCATSRAAATTTASCTPPTRPPPRRRGQPTVILAKTIKGWTLGPEIEARNSTHQIKKMNAAQLKLLRDRLYLQDEIPDAALEKGEPPFYSPAAGLGRIRVHDGAPAGPQRVASPPGRAGQAAAGAGREDAGRVRRRLGQARRVDDHGLRGDAAQPAARQGRRPADRADHPRRGPHLRHGRPVQGGQDLRPARPAVRAGRLQADADLLRGQGRPDPGGGHQRGRRHGGLHRRRDGLRHLGPAHDPVLHLLLHVRVPAGRRPDLGVRRHAGPRLPARGHGRPHHPARRGTAARRRPLVAAGVHRAQRAGLRPGVRLRGGGHRRGRHHAGCTAPSPRTSSTT